MVKFDDDQPIETILCERREEDVGKGAGIYTTSEAKSESLTKCTLLSTY